MIGGGAEDALPARAAGTAAPRRSPRRELAVPADRLAGSGGTTPATNAPRRGKSGRSRVSQVTLPPSPTAVKPFAPVDRAGRRGARPAATSRISSAAQVDARARRAAGAERSAARRRRSPRRTAACTARARVVERARADPVERVREVDHADAAGERACRSRSVDVAGDVDRALPVERVARRRRTRSTGAVAPGRWKWRPPVGAEAEPRLGQPEEDRQREPRRRPRRLLRRVGGRGLADGRRRAPRAAGSSGPEVGAREQRGRRGAGGRGGSRAGQGSIALAARNRPRRRAAPGAPSEQAERGRVVHARPSRARCCVARRSREGAVERRAARVRRGASHAAA